MTKLPPIEQLLPHDRPMILVDRAIDIQQDTIHCQVDIGEHNPFFNRDTQTVPAYVGIEFMHSLLPLGLATMPYSRTGATYWVLIRQSTLHF